MCILYTRWVVLLHLCEDAEGLPVFEFVFCPPAELLYVFVVGEESVDEFYGVDDALVGGVAEEGCDV